MNSGLLAASALSGDSTATIEPRASGQKERKGSKTMMI